jgi:hypothetical protein
MKKLSALGSQPKQRQQPHIGDRWALAWGLPVWGIFLFVFLSYQHSLTILQEQMHIEHEITRQHVQRSRNHSNRVPPTEPTIKSLFPTAISPIPSHPSLKCWPNRLEISLANLKNNKSIGFSRRTKLSRYPFPPCVQNTKLTVSVTPCRSH